MIEEIRAEDEYAGRRARFRAWLGTARIRVRLDVGVADALATEPEEIEYPTLLDTLPAPRLRAYPREATVAEKLHAMVTLDTRNSRMKDFHDLWALAGAFTFDGAALLTAIATCFDRRATPWTAEAPRALTRDFYRRPELETRWRSYLRAGSVLVPPPTRFEVTGERIITFLIPVRECIVGGHAFTSVWPPGGPWQADPERAR